MHQQLSLLVAEQAADEAAVDELLAHALAGREYRRLPLEWLPQLVDLDPERRLARWVAGKAGFDVVERDRRTDGEKLAAAVAQLESLGEVGHALIKKAGLR